MKTRAPLLAVLHAAVLLAAFGCGDEGGGGCGPAQEKKKEEKAAPGGSGGGKGSPSRGGDIQIQDKKGKVPKGYQRPTSAYEPAKSTETATASAVAPAAPPARPRARIRVLKRKVNGIADRSELHCRILATSPDGQCSSSPNYAEIKERCCPGGLVELCKTTMDGVLLIGRGCDPSAP
jgi:hypothetical protein